MSFPDFLSFLSRQRSPSSASHGAGKGPSRSRLFIWALVLGAAATAVIFAPDDDPEVVGSTREPAGIGTAPSEATLPAGKAAPAPDSEPVKTKASYVIVPRSVLMKAAPAKMATGKDLFAAHDWTPPPPPTPSPPPPPPPSAPPLPFQFVGKQMAEGQWTVFLARGETTFIVKQGAEIDEQYRVDSIAPPQLTLIYLPLNLPQTLAIGEAR